MIKDKRIPQVIFLGSIWEEAPAYFLMADIFVLPSHGGLAINEVIYNSFDEINSYRLLMYSIKYSIYIKFLDVKIVRI